MRKIETRIQVVEEDGETKYYPQTKGYVEMWDGVYNRKYLYILIPLIGQLYLFILIVNYIESFFWNNLINYDYFGKYEWETLERAQDEIKYTLNKLEEVQIKSKKSKTKKKITYIKFP